MYSQVLAALALPLIALDEGAASARPEHALAIQSFIDGKLGAAHVQFRSAEVDLDGDDRPEVVVHVTRHEFCGGGGCKTLVLQRTPGGYREVMNATVTRAPIRLLRTRTHGWRDLGVMVGGGGIRPAYEARMRFDGRRYPSNPTTPPAEPLAHISGTILIDEERTF